MVTLNAGVKHVCATQATDVFVERKFVLEDVDTQSQIDFTSPHKAQTKRRQSHINAGTVPETKNAGTQGRPVAGFSAVQTPAFRLK